MTRATSTKVLVCAALVVSSLGACLSINPYPTVDAGLVCGFGDGGDGDSCDAGSDAEESRDGGEDGTLTRDGGAG